MSPKKAAEPPATGRGFSAPSWRTNTFAALNQPLTEILGDKTAKALSGLGLFTTGDLMRDIPRRYLSGTETTDLAELLPGQSVAIVARVDQLMKLGHDPKRMRLEATLGDGRRHIQAVFFGRDHIVDFWQRQLSMGVKGIFVGKTREFNGQLQLSHPDFVMLDEWGAIVGRADETKRAMASQVTRKGLVGIYPASAKLPTWQVGECAEIVLDTLNGLEDPLTPQIRTQHGLPTLLDAFTEIHRPSSLERVAQAEHRLKFDEALWLQVTMAHRRVQAGAQQAHAIPQPASGLLAAFDARLPFQLTPGQLQVSQQIFADLGKPTPMQRLLQGEVGSGKTVVALRAMLAAAQAGHQAVLLAPTEVLATQHFETIQSLLGDLASGGTLGAPQDAVELVLLTGSMTAITKKHVQDSIASGRAQLIVGTHALLQAAVKYADLGLAVIDEQHRFGVEQRAVLSESAEIHPHVLVMTATPIPRSVAMTVFGDLEVSTLRGQPLGRAGVQTTLVELRRHPAWETRIWERVREEVAGGRQVFVVAPRIDPSDKETPDPDDPDWQPGANVVELAATLSAGALNGLKLGILHGALSASEKSETMAAFTAGGLDVLVATTVIEVGVDVPNATMMVVMDADRFGISQLHQLRGRIGRGEFPGLCLLVTNTRPGTVAADRLAAVAATNDGFELAELDLAQRREGNILGADQSGARSSLRLLRVIEDADLIAEARTLAESLVSNDPTLSDPYLSDMVTQLETQASPEWLDRS